MKHIFLFISLFFSVFGSAQNSLDELLKTYNNENIPYISVIELMEIQEQVHLFDAREKDEYEVSHIRNAINIGYTNFEIEIVKKQNIQKNDTIVVYCSLGVRSEDISEKLKEAGFTNVYNLYGGVFEWKNNNYPVINLQGQLTDKVHAYSKQWAKWLLKGKKVYSN